MFYSIKIRLPKSRIVQYDMPAPISVNDLSPQEFNKLLNDTNNHISLLKEKKIYNKQIFIEKLSPEKANQLTQFYSNSLFYFADENTSPGKNNTLNLKTGKPIFRDLKAISLEMIQNAYSQLGVQPIPIIRVNGKNIYYPNYEVNNYYRIDFQTPDTQIFLNILRDMKNNNLFDRMTETVYQSLSKQYYFNNIWYQLKSLSNLQFEEKQAFESFKNEINPKISSFRENPYAWESFLDQLPKDTTDRTYKDFVDNKFEKIKDLYNKEISIFKFNNENYHILKMTQIRQPINISLKTVYDEKIVENREPTSSLGDKVFYNIQQNNLTQNIIPQHLFFKKGYLCSKDLRFEEFVETHISKGREKDIFTYLFSSIKSNKTIIERNGKNIHCYNLSNSFFEKYAQVKDGWLDRINIDLNDPKQKDRWDKKIFEFELECVEFANDAMKSCTKWRCQTNTPERDGTVKENVIFMNNNNFDPSAYSFDAVVVDGSGQVQYILEFDGSDHYYGRPNTQMDITNKIVSDQIKNNFATFYNIPIKRIPYFARRKDGNFERDFQDYILKLLSEQYVPNYIKPSETVNPAIREVPAYTIRKIIK